MLKITKTYYLFEKFSGHLNWSTKIVFNGAIRNLCVFLEKHLVRLKDSTLHVVRRKWVIGLDPLDLIINSIAVNIKVAESILYLNGYYLYVELKNEKKLFVFLEFGGKSIRTYIPKEVLRSSDMFVISRIHDFSNKSKVTLYSELGLILNKEVSSQRRSSPLIDYTDWLFWFMLILLIILLINHRSVFGFILKRIKNIYSFIKSKIRLIPLGFVRVLPVLHNLLGYGRLKHWVFAIIFKAIRLVRRLGWKVLIYSILCIGTVIIALTFYKLCSSLGLFDIVHWLYNWFNSVPNITLPTVPTHQIGERLSSSSSEETQQLIIRFRRLVEVVNQQGSPLIQAIEHVQREVATVMELEANDVPLEEQQNPLQQEEVKLGVLICAALMVTAGSKLLLR